MIGGRSVREQTDVLPIDTDQHRNVEGGDHLGVLLDGVGKEVLDLEADDLLRLGVDSQIEVVAVSKIERHAGGWARLAVEIDKERVGRSVVRGAYLLHADLVEIGPRWRKGLDVGRVLGHGHRGTSPRPSRLVG